MLVGNSWKLFWSRSDLRGRVEPYRRQSFTTRYLRLLLYSWKPFNLNKMRTYEKIEMQKFIGEI